MCMRDSVIFDARLPCAHTSRRSIQTCMGHIQDISTHPGVFLVLVPRRAQVQGRIENVVRVCVFIRILLLLILKSRALTTITQRIERDVKKSGIMQQYSGTPGVKSNFRDYPGKSGRVGRSDIIY